MSCDATPRSEHTILIVEDEIFVAMDIERILGEAGYRVIAIAADQQEAITHGEDARIAFVDINLRDGPTGPAIACALAGKGTRVIYVTANPQQIEPRAETAIGYIRKPFSDTAILSAAEIAAAGTPLATPAEGVILFASGS